MRKLIAFILFASVAFYTMSHVADALIASGTASVEARAARQMGE